MTYRMRPPRDVVSGKGSLEQIGEIVSSYAPTSVAFLVDGNVRKNGGADRILELLSVQGAELHVFSDLPVEPETGQVKDLFGKLSGLGVDLVVAMGGGSVLDSAKMVAVLLRNPAYLDNLLDAQLIRERGVPLIAIPTSAGTGSEATPNSIVVVPEQKLKVGVVHPFFIPDCVVLDPSVTLTLPPNVTAATGLDAFCHAIECFISKKRNPFSDLYALEAIRLISRSLMKAYKDGSDLQAREDLLLAAFYGGMCIASSSTVAVHALSYPLGGRYRIPHGISNAILLPWVMEFNRDTVTDRFTEVASAMGIPPGADDGETSKKTVEGIFSLVRSLGIPSDLRELGVRKEDLDEIVAAAMKVTRLLDNNPKPVTPEDARNIYLKLLP
ncbi:iron-containing alcohol dehydrogenase [Aminivibrio sp.]|uniref:iron-containing alcohol dehydrogenase n=1 Tax=Aminivibrio sp. TaxID=1872489 RepID=UPI00345E10E5